MKRKYNPAIIYETENKPSRGLCKTCGQPVESFETTHTWHVVAEEMFFSSDPSVNAEWALMLYVILDGGRYYASTGHEPILVRSLNEGLAVILENFEEWVDDCMSHNEDDDY